MGRRQVVRHEFLVLAFAGSNPAAPAINLKAKRHSFFFLILYLNFLSMDKLPEPLRNIAKVITPHIKGYSYPSLLQKKQCGK